MKGYLLDTNICIYYLKGKFDLSNKIKSVGNENCFISEITIAELKYGAAKSAKAEENSKVVKAFILEFNILPIYLSLDIYASEKARLRKLGNIVDDFDLLIGSTAIAKNLVMVPNNVDHFDRLEGITIEDWTKENIKIHSK